MPGHLLHAGANITCSHGGRAQPAASNPRVTVLGQPTVVLADPYVVVGCPVGCVSAEFVSAATRVTASGQPVLLADSQAVCSPTGSPLLVQGSQNRVTGV
jgi:hypothetical protein